MDFIESRFLGSMKNVVVFVFVVFVAGIANQLYRFNNNYIYAISHKFINLFNPCSDMGVAPPIEAGPRYPLIRLQALGAGRYPLLSLTQNSPFLTFPGAVSPQPPAREVCDIKTQSLFIFSSS